FLACFFFFFQAEDGIRDFHVTGVQTCALPIWPTGSRGWSRRCRWPNSTASRPASRPSSPARAPSRSPPPASSRRHPKCRRNSPPRGATVAESDAEAQRQRALARHWRASLRLTAALLALWFAVVVVAAIYARVLSDFSVLGIPLSFYIFAQGAPLLFLAIIGV